MPKTSSTSLRVVREVDDEDGNNDDEEMAKPRKIEEVKRQAMSSLCHIKQKKAPTLVSSPSHSFPAFISPTHLSSAIVSWAHRSSVTSSSLGSSSYRRQGASICHYMEYGWSG